MSEWQETKWKEDYIFDVYEMLKAGIHPRDISKKWGISIHTYEMWKKRKPKFKDAVLRGLGKGKYKPVEPKFNEYVYSRLPSELKDLWDDIQFVDDDSDKSDWLERMLKGEGETARKQLFIYALAKCNFNPSEALYKTNVSRFMLEKWTREDLEFQKMLKEIHWHKKNFFEGALVNLVRRGDPTSVRFVNETFNKDRGYNKQIDLNINENISIEDKRDLNNLDIPIETRRLLLEAMQQEAIEEEITEEPEEVISDEDAEADFFDE